jgi:2-deoxy-D-gluconate 3-dehydrogenase
MIKKIGELFDLSGKVAIVTGAAQGIGKGIALRLADAGARIIIADVNLEAAQKTAAEMKKDGFNAEAVQADISKVADAEKMVKETITAFGDMHILVNNVGIYPSTKTIDMTEDFWDKTLDLNLKGTMFVSQAAARVMRDKGHGGRIINIASIAAFQYEATRAPYSISKAGVVMLTKALAKEWASAGILVNAIAPGAIVPSEVLANIKNMTAEQRAGMEPFISRIPVGRMGEPDDIAKVVLFLASEASSYITGHTIVVDGGTLL